MSKKIIIFIMLICLHITASEPLEQESTRDRGPFINLISNGLPRKIAVATTAIFCICVDRTILSTTKNWGDCVKIAFADVLLPEALEGPLVNKKWSERIIKGFCILSIIASPETAIGSHACYYVADKIAKYYELDPINRTTCSYFAGRLGGILSQFLIPAALSFTENMMPQMLYPYTWFYGS